MWTYEKKLQYPVNIKNPNPKLAMAIITQLGGPDGELSASLRYLNQRYATPYAEVKGVLTDIGISVSELHTTKPFYGFALYSLKNVYKAYFLVGVMKMSKIKKIDRLPENFRPKYCKKSVCGDIIEFTEINAKPSAPSIRKLSADEFVYLETGEVGKYNKSSKRSDNTESLRKTFKKLRDLINCNCTDNSKVHWVTLTYRENMTDTKQLYNDFRKFYQRFCYWCNNENYIPPKYISVIEPQNRGAWHIHCIFIWNCKRPYIDNNKVFAPIWGHGFTHINSVDNCNNLGLYLTSHLTNTPSKDGKPSSKSVNKNDRLKLYPVGMKIYRSSRGLKKPDVKEIDVKDIENEKASSGKLSFSTYFSVPSDDNPEANRIISKSYYNKRKRCCQYFKEFFAIFYRTLKIFNKWSYILLT